jgi:cytochrome c2
VFTWTDNGWVNVDKPVNIPVAPNGIVGEDLNKKLEVQVDDARSFERVHVYVIFEDIKSLYKLNTDNNILHYVGGDDHKMIMYKDKKAVIITVAYKKDTIPYLGIKNFVTGKTEFINTSVSRSSPEEVAHAMKEVEKDNYDPRKIAEERKDGDIHVSKPSNYAEENSVMVDLTYQSYFRKEEKRQEQMQREQRALDHLYTIVYPCKCQGEGLAAGRSLFLSNCTSCHSIDQAQAGPALAGTTYRHDRKWLYAWTRDWSKLVASGDADAISIQNYAPSEMNRFPGITDEQLKELYDYIECESGEAVMMQQAAK